MIQILNDEIARLDVAAKAEYSDALASRVRKHLLLIFILACILSLFIPAASFYETMGLVLLGAFAGLAALALKTDWRYKFYLPALFYFIGAVVIVAYDEPSYPPLDWVPRFAIPIIFLFPLSRHLWRIAACFAMANSPGWEKEQNQVYGWLVELTRPRLSAGVIEFSGGTFWAGYYTYRVMRPGRYWVLATFKNGSTRKLLGLRVLQLSELTLRLLEVDQVEVHLMNGSFLAVTPSPDVVKDLRNFPPAENA